MSETTEKVLIQETVLLGANCLIVKGLPPDKIYILPDRPSDSFRQFIEQLMGDIQVQIGIPPTLMDDLKELNARRDARILRLNLLVK